MKPLVTIGVPTYNRPEGLHKALSNILNQTYCNLEVIVSNNASTNPEVDNVVQRILKNDARVKYYHHKHNIGAFLNFKFVLEKANGEYFMWAADDDWMNENYIECCLNFLQGHPDFASAYGRISVYHPSGEFEKYDSSIDLIQNNAADRVISYFRGVTHNGCFYGLIRMSFLRNIIFKNCIANDWLLVAQLAFLGKYKVIGFTNYNISLGGVSQSIEHLTQVFNMSCFTKAFPYFTIGLNIIRNIMWESEVYKKIGLLARFKLAKECFLIVYNRHTVKKELRHNYRKYLRLKKEQLKIVIGLRQEASFNLTKNS